MRLRDKLRMLFTGKLPEPPLGYSWQAGFPGLFGTRGLVLRPDMYPPQLPPFVTAKETGHE